MVILTLSPTVSVELKSIHDTPIPFQKDMMVRRIENALLNILYSCLKHTER